MAVVRNAGPVAVTPVGLLEIKWMGLWPSSAMLVALKVIESKRLWMGDEVADGDELFRIDPVPYEIAVAESEAGLRLARAQQENAEAEEGRIERLVEERATSMSVRDEHKTASAVAAAQVAQMEARLAAAQADCEVTESARAHSYFLSKQVQKTA